MMRYLALLLMLLSLGFTTAGLTGCQPSATDTSGTSVEEEDQADEEEEEEEMDMEEEEG